MDGVNREWLFRELRQSLGLLAADGDIALTGLPDGCCKADELALDFGNFRSAIVGTFAAELPPDVVAALAGVDAALGGIGSKDWSEEAVRSSPAWAAVRERAGVALQLLERSES